MTASTFNRPRILLAAAAALAGLAMLAPPLAAHPEHDSSKNSYVYYAPGGGSSSMNGSRDDWHLAQKLRAGREAMLYVRKGEDAYVIRDTATLRRADSIFEPQRALGKKQSELGARQAELGRRQALLGLQQGELGREQGRLGELTEGKIHALLAEALQRGVAQRVD